MATHSSKIMKYLRVWRKSSSLTTVYYTMAGLRVSRENLCGAKESYATNYEEFATFGEIFHEDGRFRVRPPEVRWR